MADEVREVVHQHPAWHERSNFIIAAPIQDGGDVQTEQLWARQIDDSRFEICCIPFFIYNLALGDIVETDADYLVRKVAAPSGRYVFRVWFGESLSSAQQIADQLISLGSLIEWSGPNLIAVDAVDSPHAQLVAKFLAERHNAGDLVYETGRT